MTSPCSAPDRRIRRAAQAGRFYPASPTALRAEIETYLAAIPPGGGEVPKAVIAPHAGYIYSGPVAASAYARLAQGRGRIRRVVLIGPSHFVDFRGIAASGMDGFMTPLGMVAVDRGGTTLAVGLPGVRINDAPHEPEHSLEVHLPFLQMVLGEFQIVPLLIGEAGEEEVARVLDAVWGGPEAAIVVSSDLSHYHDYATARALDASTVRLIEELRSDTLDGNDACGFEGIRGLLAVARRRRLVCRAIDVRSSGDTAGARSRVVGYGAFVLHPRAE